MPLMVAATFAPATLIEAVLAAGADVAPANQSGETALYLLDHSADPRVRSRHGDTVWSGRFSDPALIGAFIAHGADVNARNALGETPLRQARALLRLVPAISPLGIKTYIALLVKAGATERGRRG